MTPSLTVIQQRYKWAYEATVSIDITARQISFVYQGNKYIVMQHEGRVDSLLTQPIPSYGIDKPPKASRTNLFSVIEMLNKKEFQVLLKKFYKNLSKNTEKIIPVDEMHDREVAEISRAAKQRFGQHVDNFTLAKSQTPIGFSDYSETRVHSSIIPIIKPKPINPFNDALKAQSNEILEEVLQETIQATTQKALEELKEDKWKRQLIKANIKQQNIFTILTYYVCFLLATLVLELFRERANV